MNVFTYWQGPMPSLVQILIELMHLHSRDGKNYRFTCLDGAAFLAEHYDAPDCFEALSLNHQSDIVRVYSIFKHGGIWLDADTLVMDSMRQLTDIVSTRCFFVTEGYQSICAGVFGAPARNPFMAQWKAYQIKLLKELGPNLPWTSLGNQFLTDTFNLDRALYGDSIVYNGPATMYPVMWDKCVEAFLKKPFPNFKLIQRSHQPLIVLVNSVYRELDMFSRQDIINANYPLNFFITQSLKNLLL
jgi:hypothetical protein